MVDEIEFYKKPKYIKFFSKNLKHNQTPAEKKLRKKLRAKRLNWLKFHRQKPIFAYREEESHRDRFFIADFYHHPTKLIIEIDGSIHHKNIVKEYDKIREFLLKETGYKIIRFSNQEVLNNIEKVCKKILETIKSLTT